MINKTVAIAALARDCEANLPENIKRTEKLRKEFSESFVFVYENNSKDATRKILNRWHEEYSNVYVKSEDLDESFSSKGIATSRWYRETSIGRIKKMCDCRNKLMQMISEVCCPDILILLDSDVEWFSVKGIIAAIEEAPADFGALFSNCYMSYAYSGKILKMPLYYDTFGYLEKGRNPLDVEVKEIHILRRFWLACKLSREVNANNYFECVSAFGGVGIYRYDEIKNEKYEIIQPHGWEEKGLCMCEHIDFNAHIKNRNYIAKKLEVRYGTMVGSNIKSILVHYFPRIYALLGIIKSTLR